MFSPSFTGTTIIVCFVILFCYYLICIVLARCKSRHLFYYRQDFVVFSQTYLIFLLLQSGGGLSVVRQMHDLLRIGNVDAFAGEEFVDVLLHLVIDRPIVFRLDPHSHDKVHAAVAEVVHANEGKFVVGLLEDAGVGGKEVKEFATHHFHVFSVVYADGPLHTACAHLGIVHDDGGAETSVGDIDQFIVGGHEDGVEDLDFVNAPLHALCFNPVSDAIGFEEQDDESAREVLEVTG